MCVQDTCTYAPKAQSCHTYLKRAPTRVGGCFICIGSAKTGPGMSVKIYIGMQLGMGSNLQARKIKKYIYKIFFEVKCMFQRVYFLVHFLSLAQKMIEKWWHLSQMPYAEAFFPFFFFPRRYLLASLLSTRHWKIVFLYYTTASIGPSGNGMLVFYRSKSVDPACFSVFYG